jgi:hypothetical protein
MKIEKVKKKDLPKDIGVMKILAERKKVMWELDIEAEDNIIKDLAEYGLREIKKNRMELASYGFRRVLENFIESEEKKKKR